MFVLNLLLIYQLENYNNIKFFKFAYENFSFWIKGSERQKIDWTIKAVLIFIISIVVFLSLNFLIIYFYGLSYFIGSIFVSFLLYPFIISISNFLIYPFDVISKQLIIKKAKNKLKKHHKLKIIGITGSYGKTTTKEFLKIILSERFKTIATPGTHNTPIGISRFILSNLKEDTEIMIVEMGAYKKGDIHELCKITMPDIGVLTGITFQHLEKFGNIDNIIKTKFELAMNIKPGGLFIFDGTNENILKGIELYKDNLSKIKSIPIKNIEVSYLPNLGGIDFAFEGNNYQSKLIAKHNAINLSFAIYVANKLGITIEDIKNVVSKKVDFVPHRMQLIKNPKGVYIVDDSFNGNFEGVKSTIDFLKNTNDLSGRKIYLTPGIVELGDMNQEIHIEIGKILRDAVDMVLLISNSATKFIKIGLEESGFDSKNIKIYDTATQAHNDLPNILKAGDLIVFQNDWTDNYK